MVNPPACRRVSLSCIAVGRRDADSRLGKRDIEEETVRPLRALWKDIGLSIPMAAHD